MAAKTRASGPSRLMGSTPQLKSASRRQIGHGSTNYAVQKADREARRSGRARRRELRRASRGERHLLTRWIRMVGGQPLDD